MSRQQPSLHTVVNTTIERLGSRRQNRAPNQWMYHSEVQTSSRQLYVMCFVSAILMLASFAVVTTLRADFNDDKFDVLVSVVAVTTCLTSFCTTMASGMFIIFLNGIPVETYQDEQNVHASGVFIWGFLFIYIAFGFSCLFTVTLVMLLAYAGLATGNQDEEVVAIVVMTIGPCCCFVIYVCCFCISCVGQPPMSSNGPAEKMDVEAQRPTTRATDDMDRVTDSTDDEVDITTESNSSGSLTASSRSS